MHILNYTVLNLNPEFKTLEWVCGSGQYEGKTLHDVYAMLILAFSKPAVSILYIAAMFAIGFHLVHAVSSMFQSVGLRGEAVRYKLNAVAAIYAVAIFGGFALNPIAVLVSKYTPLEIVPVKQVVSQYEAQAAAKNGKVFIDYSFLKKCGEKAPCKIEKPAK